jgi:hypothetical protein
MPQTATIKSLPAAFAMMKAMQAEGVEWGEDYRGVARQALAELLEGRMDQLIFGDCGIKLHICPTSIPVMRGDRGPDHMCKQARQIKR